MNAKRCGALVVLVVAAVTAGASAQGQSDPSPARPAVGPIVVPIAPRPDTARLANGIRVVALPIGASPRAVVRVVLETGPDYAADCDQADVIVNLLKRGSGRLQGSRLIDSIAHMGGTLNVSRGAERVELTTQVLERFAPATVALLGQIVIQPSIDVPTVRLAMRDVLLARTGAGRGLDAPALQAFQAIVFPTDEFRTICDAAGASTVNDSTVRAYFAARFDPVHTTLFIVGRYDRRQVLASVAAVFGKWAGHGAARRDRRPTLVGVPAVRIVQRPGAKQAAIVVGAPAPPAGTSDFNSFPIVDAMLGGGLISRITMNIREAKGYAYGPTSTIAIAPSGASYWAETADVAANVAWPTVREILHEIDRLATVPPAKDEVMATQRFVAGTTLLTRASRFGTVDEIERQDQLRHVYGVAAADQSAAAHVITPAAVQGLTAAYLSPSRLTIVVAADTSVLGAQADSIRAAVKRGKE